MLWKFCDNAPCLRLRRSFLVYLIGASAPSGPSRRHDFETASSDSKIRTSNSHVGVKLLFRIFRSRKFCDGFGSKPRQYEKTTQQLYAGRAVHVQL